VEVVVDNECTLTSNPYPVVVHEAPVVTVDNDGTECVTPGTDVNLTAVVTGGSGNFDIEWTGPNGFTSVNMNPVLPNATNQTAGTYTVVITDISGCTAAASTVVDVTTLPQTPTIASVKDALCIDGILQLQTDAYDGTVVEYTWIFEGTTSTTYTTSSPGLNLLDVEVTEQGLYSVYVTVDGCTSLVSAEQYITVGAQPETPAVVATIDLCAGDAIVLTTSAIADNYTWVGPNGFTSSEQNPTAILNADELDAGNYTLIVDNNGCESDPATVVVSVEALPISPILIMESSICEGQDIVLTAFGDPSYSYQWISPSNTSNGYFGNLGDPNNVIWTTTTSTTITAGANPQFYEGGTWRVQAISPNGCVSEYSVGQDLAINEVPEEPIASNSGPICETESVQLFASPVPNAEYRWYDGDPYASPSVAAMISTEQNPIVSGLPAGMSSFYLTVDVFGCEPISADRTDVEVMATPIVAAVDNTGPYCGGDVIQLEAPTIAGATYSWTGPNGFTSFEEDPMITDADQEDEGVYTLVVTTQTALCPSAPMTTNVFITGVAATPTVENSGPVCENEMIQLFGSDVPVGNDAVYAWTGPNGYVSNVQNPVIENVSEIHEGDYTLVVTVNGCPSLVSAPTTLVMNAVPELPIATNNTAVATPACEGGDLELGTDFIPGATYQWFGPNGYEATEHNPIIIDADSTHVGEYVVFVTMNGCTSEAGNTMAYIQSTPNVPIATNNGPVCTGDDLTLNVTNINSDASYIWYDSLTNEVIGSGNEVVLAETDMFMTGTYYVVSTINGCDSDPAELLASGEDAYAEVVIDIPSPDEAYAGEDMVVCSDQADVSAYPVTVWNGQWSMMDEESVVEILNPNELSTVVNDLALGENTFLWSIHSGACGITSQDTLNVTYQIGPETNDDQYTTPLNTALTETMMWNDVANTDSFTISVTSPVSNGSLEIASDGTFTYTPDQGYAGVDQFSYIICNAYCPDQCSESVVTIDIGVNTECVAPEAITPNDDGFNDTFIIPCLDNYDGPSGLCIYNRWGDEVYNAEDYKNDWNGTYKEENLPVGVYFYVLKVADGNDTTLKGYIMIQR